MKKILIIIAALVVLIPAAFITILAFQDEDVEPATEATTETTEVEDTDVITTAEADKNGEYADFAGVYTNSEDGSTLTINGDGSVKIDIVRLTSIEGKITETPHEVLIISAKDANGKDMSLEFWTDEYCLIVADSEWEYLPVDEVLEFDQKN